MSWPTLMEIPFPILFVYDNQGRKWERENDDWVTYSSYVQRWSTAVTDLSGWGPFVISLLIATEGDRVMTPDTSPLRGQTVTLIWERDFSDLVATTYDRPYSVRAQDPSCSAVQENTIRLFTAPTPVSQMTMPNNYPGQHPGQPTLGAWEAIKAPVEVEERKFWESVHYPQLGEVVSDLVERGLLAPGEYALWFFNV